MNHHVIQDVIKKKKKRKYFVRIVSSPTNLSK